MIKSKRSYAVNGLWRSVFLLVHLAVPLCVIIWFKNSYFLNNKVVEYHLLIVTGLYIFISALSMLFIHIGRRTGKSFVQYIISLLWGGTAVFMYTVYLLAFLGKENNSRIFTFDILFGYLKDVQIFAGNMGISMAVVYTIIAVLPVTIIAIYLALHRLIYSGMLQINNFVYRLVGGGTAALYGLRLIGVIVAIGIITGILTYNFHGFYRRVIQLEEPVSSVFSKRFQGLSMGTYPESKAVRDNYPKNIPFEKKNVVLIVVDALRADHLSMYGYHRKTSSFLDSLYGTGNLKKVSLALSNAGGSFPGILSIIRSKSWHNMSDRNFSLPDLLKDQGYALNFFISGDHTHFYGLKTYYSDSFNFYIDGSSTKKYSVNDDRLIFEGLEKIPPYANNPAYFHFHLNSVHVAGKRLPENRIFLPYQHGRKIVKYYVNNYDNGIVQADHNIKKIFEWLKAKGYLQNSLVVITADHGEGLGEHHVLSHAKNVYTDHTLIPLLIYDTAAGDRYKNLDFATQVDIAPTIIERLGLPVPKSWEGYSLLKEKPDIYTFHQMNGYYAIVHRKGKLLYKYIYNHNKQTEELYELRSDLYEHHNLINTESKPYIDSLRRMLNVFKINDQ